MDTPTKEASSPAVDLAERLIDRDHNAVIVGQHKRQLASRQRLDRGGLGPGLWLHGPHPGSDRPDRSAAQGLVGPQR